MNLEQKIEAILFYKNEPMEVGMLAKILDTSEEEIRTALENLSKYLEKRGVTLINTGSEVSLATARNMNETIEKIAKEEMRSEIGKAGLETLAIILYNGPVSRREVDNIRGVNSTFIIRNLSVRGLIEKDQVNGNQKTPKYKGTISLLAHLGINKFEDLPEFNLFKKKAEEVNVGDNGSR